MSFLTIDHRQTVLQEDDYILFGKNSRTDAKFIWFKRSGEFILVGKAYRMQISQRTFHEAEFVSRMMAIAVGLGTKRLPKNVLDEESAAAGFQLVRG